MPHKITNTAQNPSYPDQTTNAAAASSSTIQGRDVRKKKLNDKEAQTERLKHRALSRRGIATTNLKAGKLVYSPPVASSSAASSSTSQGGDIREQRPSKGEKRIRRALARRGNFTQNLVDLSRTPVCLDNYGLSKELLDQLYEIGVRSPNKRLNEKGFLFMVKNGVLHVYTQHEIGKGAFKRVTKTICYGKQAEAIWTKATACVTKNPKEALTEITVQSRLGKSTSRCLGEVDNLETSRGWGNKVVAVTFDMKEYEGDLKKAVATGASPLTILTVLRDVAKCLVETEKEGTFHRDLKLENIFIEVDPTSEDFIRGKVGDWGLKWETGDQPPQNRGLGNLLHQAPEVAAAYKSGQNGGVLQCSEAAEVWAVGIMLYHALWTKSEEVYPQWLFNMVVCLSGRGHNHKDPSQAQIDATIGSLRQTSELQKRAAVLLSKLLKRDPAKRLSMEETRKEFDLLIELATEDLAANSPDLSTSSSSDTDGE